MQNNYQTKRLILNELTLNDDVFITELLNTPEWIKFIGDRNVRTHENARDYIKKIANTPSIKYWIVRLADQKTSIGIITFIKRDYLAHHDIGFAFLSKFTNKGYALEATRAVLNNVIQNPAHTHILATTVRENFNSIKLLEKLGLSFQNEIQIENDSLLVYSVLVDKLVINQVTDLFYSAFTNVDQQAPALQKIYATCLPEAIIVKKNNKTEEIFTLNSFIEPRRKILSDGTLTEFKEYQIFEETKVVGSIAQRFSKYKKSGYLNGEYFEAGGTKLFQYVKTNKGWKIASVIWEDENV